MDQHHAARSATEGSPQPHRSAPSRRETAILDVVRSVAALIRSQGQVTLSWIDADQLPTPRVLAIPQAPFDGRLWLSVRTPPSAAAHLPPRAAVTMEVGSASSWVSLTGFAVRADGDTAASGVGPHPDIPPETAALLQVTVHDVVFWEAAHQNVETTAPGRRHRIGPPAGRTDGPTPSTGRRAGSPGTLAR